MKTNPPTKHPLTLAFQIVQHVGTKPTSTILQECCANTIICFHGKHGKVGEILHFKLMPK